MIIFLIKRVNISFLACQQFCRSTFTFPNHFSFYDFYSGLQLYISVSNSRSSSLPTIIYIRLQLGYDKIHNRKIKRIIYMYVYMKNRNQYRVSKTRVTSTCVQCLRFHKHVFNTNYISLQRYKQIKSERRLTVLVLVHSSCTKGKGTK